MSRQSRYEEALELICNRFKKIKPSSRTALYISCILGKSRKKCNKCQHLLDMHSKEYGYCVHLVGCELCKCVVK